MKLFKITVLFLDGGKSSFYWNGNSAEEVKQRVINDFPHAMPFTKDIQVMDDYTTVETSA